MNRSPAIRSFLEIIPIDDVRHQLNEILSCDFNPSELKMERNKKVQTIAGRLALKHAICRLAAQCYGLEELVPHDITINTTAEGTPLIADVDVGSATWARTLLLDIFVSISHSKTSATGMAVLSLERRA